MGFPLKSFDVHLRVEKGLAVATAKAYLSDVRQAETFVQSLGTSLLQASPEDIRQYLAHLSLDDAQSAFSLARKLSALRQAYMFLQQEGLRNDNPCERVDGPKLRRHLPHVLNLQEVNALMDTCNPSDPLGLRNRAMMEVLYSSGLRASELLGLNWEDVFFDEGFVRVVGKGNKQRLSPMGRQASLRLLEYRNEVWVHQTPQRHAMGAVFLNRRGGRLTRQMLFVVLQTAARQAGLTKPVGPHSLRHAFATHLLEGGADLVALKDMLGHAHLTTTELYLHLDRDYLRSVHRSFHPRG